MSTKNTPATRHIISINDLTDREIETVFDIAQSFLRGQPHKVAIATTLFKDRIEQMKD